MSLRTVAEVLPIDIGHNPAPVDAPAPEDDPPGHLSSLQGLMGVPNIVFIPVTPTPISCMFVFPTRMAPMDLRVVMKAASSESFTLVRIIKQSRF